jgi:Rha family phage regulatory protein
MNAIALTPEQFIFAQDSELKTTSLKIAEAFGKRHDHVIRGIRQIIESLKDIPAAPIFGECTRINELANGKPEPYFEMGKDGFMLVVMSYTGVKAMAVKVAYINAFNYMADKLFPKTRYGLLELPEPPTITNAQAGQLFGTVDSIAGADNKIRAAIWKRFQLHFGVSSYKLLPADKFDDAVEYLEQKRIEYRDGATMLYISDKELEARIEEKVKALEGDLLSKSNSPNTLTIDLDLPEGLKQMTLSFNSNPLLGGRWVLWHAGDRLTIKPIAQDEFTATSETLARIVGDSMGGAVKRQHLAEIIEAAAKRMK